MSTIRRKQLTPEQAVVKLETTCAASEQCRWECYQKLRRWGIAQTQADEIVQSLARRRFVDDERFAIAFVNDKYRFARWGKRKISLALAQKHITRDTIAAALSEINDDEYNRILLSVMKAKARTLKEGNSFEGRTKLFRFAVSRGYETTLIARQLKNPQLWES